MVRLDNAMLPEGPATLPIQERRAAARHLCPRRSIVAVVIRPSFAVLEAFLEDVASGGVGLRVNAALEPGSVLAVQPPHMHAGCPRTVLARVTHTMPGPFNDRLIGCTLADPLNEDELEACLLPP